MPSVTPATGADPLASRLPVTVITGFLGSGKTTLLRRLLRHPGMNRAAVVINEFGDVALDHELVEASSEQVTLLGNGCLCCTMRTDLQQTLRDLYIRRRAGEVIDFDRVFVETTGLADPVPVLHTLQTDGLLAAQFRLNGVVTLVDAVNGAGQLDTMRERGSVSGMRSSSTGGWMRCCAPCSTTGPASPAMCTMPFTRSRSGPRSAVRAFRIASMPSQVNGSSNQRQNEWIAASWALADAGRSR